MRRLLLIAGFCIAGLHVFSQYSNLELIPYPAELFPGKGSFVLNEKTKIIASGAALDEVNLFVSWLTEVTGHPFKVESEYDLKAANYILFTGSRDASILQQELPNLPGNLNASGIEAEAYKISIDSSRVMITAPFDIGIFHATQTLKQLLPCPDSKGFVHLPVNLQALRITDKPRFPHRGLLLDCCRHFMTVEFVKRYIDLLSFYKMNVLHWHLTEDQGWRIQIDKYPLLTEVGAWRIDEQGQRYGGFYTKDEIRDVVRYAAERHVTIIPEIELPGHSTAAIAAYPYLSCTGEKIPVENEWGVFKDIFCAGKDSTLTFLQDVMTEVCELFPSPYIHIGGDEAPKFRWEHCSHCQKRIADEHLSGEHELQTWMIEQVAGFLKTKGKSIIGWDEILEGGIPADAMVQSWRGFEGGLQAAREGHGVVMSPTSHCYFDYGLESIDMRKVYSFDPIPPGLAPHEAAKIRGAECNMWTEHTPQEVVDNQVFPRILALSEVIWTYPEQRSYEIFMHRVSAHYKRLRAMNVDFGFPEIPVAMITKRADDGPMIVTLEKKIPEAKLQYRITRPGVTNDNEVVLFTDYKEPLILKSPSVIEVRVNFQDKQFPSKLSRTFDPHLGYGKTVSLSYEPAATYSGGGMNAMTDGRIGSQNFRDGFWQAVQGKDMEVIVDLGEVTAIRSMASNWYHYGNAWIFIPSKISYYTSKDGKDWQLLEEVVSNLDERTPGELIIPIPTSGNQNENIKARFVKMVAYNRGPCPEWHDAPGQQSWMFCDELIVH